MIFLNLKILLKMSIFQEIQVLDNLWKWTNELEKQKDIFYHLMGPSCNLMA